MNLQNCNYVIILLHGAIHETYNCTYIVIRTYVVIYKQFFI